MLFATKLLFKYIKIWQCYLILCEWLINNISVVNETALITSHNSGHKSDPNLVKTLAPALVSQIIFELP